MDPLAYDTFSVRDGLGQILTVFDFNDAELAYKLPVC